MVSLFSASHAANAQKRHGSTKVQELAKIETGRVLLGLTIIVCIPNPELTNDLNEFAGRPIVQVAAHDLKLVDSTYVNICAKT